jgi:N-acetylmuramoyl-L-alanine amidase
MKKYRTWVAGYCMILALSLLGIHLGNRAVFVMAEILPVERTHTIVIDPGHGGVDGGASSCTGLPECGFNLEISLRLRDLLNFLGHDTVMIRTEDISVYTEGDTIARKKMSDLKERVRITNGTPNALLLSIHQNTFPDGKYSGAQVFYAAAEGSQALAQKLQTAFVTHLNPGSHRQEKKAANVYLMEQIQCPGVLIECGFLSNPEETALLKTEAYQQKLAMSLYTSIMTYLTEISKAGDS